MRTENRVTLIVRRMRPIPAVRVLLVACLASILPACDESPSQAGAEASNTKDAGFEAVISGSYAGEVSGSGVLMFLPDAGFEKQGYFFLADDRGLRAHGITFVLPRGLAPGRHRLESPSPLDLGTVPSVRVDRDTGDAVISADRNTSGFLDLTAFPEGEGDIRGSDVAGRFEFETQDPKGERIAVKGAFSFTVE